MLSRFSLALTSICMFTVVSFQAAGAKCQGLPQTLERFNQAFQQADLGYLTKHVAEDYQHTNSGNLPIDKTRWLNWVGSRSAAVESGELKYSRYETQDLRLDCLGELATATGRNVAEGTDKGSAFLVDIRFTHVWVKRDNRWQRLVFHDAAAN